MRFLQRATIVRLVWYFIRLGEASRQTFILHLYRAGRAGLSVRGSKNNLEDPLVHASLVNTPKQTCWIASSFIRASTTAPNRRHTVGKREESALRRDCRGIRRDITDEHVAFECRNFPSRSGFYEVCWYARITTLRTRERFERRTLRRNNDAAWFQNSLWESDKSRHFRDSDRAADVTNDTSEKSERSIRARELARASSSYPERDLLFR